MQGDVEETTLPRSASAASAGRRFVQTFCRAHDVRAAAEADAVLITSELVGNAFLHARSGTVLRLSVERHVLRIEVADSSARGPVIGSAGLRDDHGRGVQIMDALAQRWGVVPRPEGKSIWFELDLSDEPR